MANLFGTTHKLITKSGAFALGKVISDGETNDIYGGRKLVFHRTTLTGEANELVGTRFDITDFGQYNSFRFDEVDLIKVNQEP